MIVIKGNVILVDGFAVGTVDESKYPVVSSEAR